MSTTTRIEKPMLFSTDMVRAIQRGEKSQTRRIIKPQPMEDDIICGPELYYPEKVDKNGEYYPGDEVFGIYTDNQGWVCPHPPGSVIWVRETWSQDERGGYEPNGEWAVYYRADMPSNKIWAGYWKPSIFMPRWAARIFLEVVAVKCERVQDISEADAIAEGVNIYKRGGLYYPPCNGDLGVEFARTAFFCLFDSINGKRPGCSVADDPHVWAYTIRKLEDYNGLL